MAIPRPRQRRSTEQRNGGRPVMTVVSLSRKATRGWLRFGPLTMPCALGRSGRAFTKREGDGATPSGRWHPLAVFYRSDRLQRPLTRLPIRALRRSDGWCDAVGDRNYNRFVEHPYPASVEHLWRDDAIYDVIVVLDHNRRPRMQARGSAIFMHLARPGYSPTEGCIAVSRRDMQRLLSRLGTGARLLIG